MRASRGGLGGRRVRDVVVHGETGLLVPAGDASALREAIVTLVSDPKLRARMGHAGRRRAERYTVSAVTDEIERIYREEVRQR